MINIDIEEREKFTRQVSILLRYNLKVHNIDFKNEELIQNLANKIGWKMDYDFSIPDSRKKEFEKKVKSRFRLEVDWENTPPKLLKELADEIGWLEI